MWWRKFILWCIALGLAGAGVLFFVGQLMVSQRTGEIDTLVLGLFVSGLMGFAAVLLLAMARKIGR